MSGRTRVVLSDGRMVRGFRKTLRRNPCRKPLVLIRKAPPLPPDLPPDPRSADYPVRLTFLLPDSILVSPGPHGFNVTVLPHGFVRIRGRNADHCFSLARCFFAAVAKERAGFTCHACIARDDDPRTYGRHLTVLGVRW